MILVVPVSSDGNIGPSFGKASAVAVVQVEGAEITGWDEFGVGWDLAHDSATRGSHHARIVTFLREHHVERVVANHIGDPMQRTLASMGVKAVLGVAGEARTAVLKAASL